MCVCTCLTHVRRQLAAAITNSDNDDDTVMLLTCDAPDLSNTGGRGDHELVQVHGVHLEERAVQAAHLWLQVSVHTRI